jgi:hypothetical protein
MNRLSHDNIGIEPRETNRTSLGPTSFRGGGHYHAESEDGTAVRDTITCRHTAAERREFMTLRGFFR